MYSCVIFANLYFKEFFNFILVIYWHKVFLVICSYPFYARRICSDVPSFIPDIGNLCLLSVFYLPSLRLINFIDHFKELDLGCSHLNFVHILFY